MSGFSLNGYGYIMGDLTPPGSNQSGRIKVWRYDPSSNQWKVLEKEYPGNGAYAIKTVSLKEVAYVGLGYNIGDLDVIDFWSFR